MIDPFEVLTKSIQTIQDQQDYPKVEVQPGFHLVHDLGLASLDIAQLLAMMECELGIDPFVHGATLDQVATVKDMADLYFKNIN